jgi:hypothetical protein
MRELKKNEKSEINAESKNEFIKIMKKTKIKTLKSNSYDNQHIENNRNNR